MMIWGHMCYLIHNLKPALMMVVAQITFGGVNLLYKLAANDGMISKVIVAYRLIFATGFMVPVALIFERQSRRKLNLKILFLSFLSGLFGASLLHNLFTESLVLTSAIFASAMLNLIPVITFILAISIGSEKLGIRTRTGKAKFFGTLLGVGGAMLLTFYKGEEIKIWSTHVHLLHHDQPRDVDVHRLTLLHEDSDIGKHVLGSMLALGSCFSFSLWLIVQDKMSKEYPYEYSSTALMCLMGAIQSTVFALCLEKDWSHWKLGWNIRLLTVAFSGIVASGLMATLIFWCVQRRGPLFASAFYPLMLVVVAVLGSLMLDEKLHLGSVLGTTMIVCGLYAVLWGKGKEMKKITPLVPTKASAEDSVSIEIVITSSPIDYEVTTGKKNNIKEKEENDSKEIEINNIKEKEENDSKEIERNDLISREYIYSSKTLY